MSFIIRDTSTEEVYQLRPGKHGWYDHDWTYVRRYKTRERAQQTIDAGNHHVTYPGNRQLVIDEVQP